MEENNIKIEKLNNRINEMQKIYDEDIERGKDEYNDQIQQNRQKKINELKEELKDVELEKIKQLEDRKNELENILKKKESLNKDKEQLEQAIYEISGKNEIQDGKLVKSQEQVEYEKDLEKVNSELDSLEDYEKELSEINAQLNKIEEKYNINKNYEDIDIFEDINISLEESEEQEINEEKLEENIDYIDFNDNIQEEIDKEVSKNTNIEQYNSEPYVEDYNYSNIDTFYDYETQPSKKANKEIIDQKKAITKYKKTSRFISWIKEKFNAIKQKFFKNKEKLDSTGQAWQDYINEQEGITEKKDIIKTCKEFKEGLKVKGQKIKESEIVRKFSKQNEKELKLKQFEEAKEWAEQNEIQQEDDEIDL